MNDKVDINKLMAMLSKMDKKQLESGLEQVQKILNSKDKNNNQ